MSRRGWAALAVLGLWVTGLGLLVRRELFRPDATRFAELGLRVTPGAVYYAVLRDGRHIGFASSTIDTTESGIELVDYLVADLPVGGRSHRASARTSVRVSRAMRLQRFLVEVNAEQGPIIGSGHVEGDSTLAVVLRAGSDARPDTQRVRLDGPILMPTMVPLAVALGSPPTVGRSYSLPVFDPIALAPTTASLRIAAESLFVMHDTATFDPATRRWVGGLPDTVRAWQVVNADAAGFSGWIDAQGRVVQTTQLGTLTLERMPYELAFENWQIAKQGRDTAGVDPADDILETTAIAANRSIGRAAELLRVRLRNVSLAGYDLASSRQALHGDTLTVRTEPPAQLAARYQLGALMRSMNAAQRDSWREYLRAEPLIEVVDPDIRATAGRIRNGERDPRIVAERINKWVHDSLQKRTTFGVPSARAVLEARAGDCNEHTQLYVALARAASLPARVAAGLVHIDGRFYYHAWPEVFLGGWVAVDPTLGQFPADASHLRFVVGGLQRQAELLRLIGTLEIDVLETR